MSSNYDFEVKMPLSEMKRYIGEWIFGDLQSSIEVGGYDSFEKIFKLRSEHDGELCFSQKFGFNEVVDDSTLVSTNGVVDEELRGLIVQCFSLDEQLNALNKNSQTQTQEVSQIEK